MPRLLPLLLTLALAPAALSAQTTAEEEVLATVQALWDAMAVHDADAAAALFHEEARMVRAGTRDGAPTVQVSPPTSFIQGLRQAAGGPGWNEKMYDPVVRVDGNLAMVWTVYTFHLGEQFSHCGVDAIHLVRTADGWKIIEIADTTRREGCPAGS